MSRADLVAAGITALATCAATNIDDIVLLMLWLSQPGERLRARQIVAGQYLGFVALLALSLIGFVGSRVLPLLPLRSRRCAYPEGAGYEAALPPEEFKRLAEAKGLLRPGVKAGEIVAWLKEDFGLGYGHAMAIYATFKGKTE